MKNELTMLIKEKVKLGLLSWSDQKELATKTGLSIRQIEEKALSLQILPTRYQRNLNAISVDEQYKLFKSKVAVVGCGGLGGYIIEELARLGVGSIRAWDYDNFEEHNLNRQLLSKTALIGHSKVEAAARRVNAINPAIDFDGINSKFNEASEELLSDRQVVIDALDNIPTRIMLANLCRKLNIPLVHGAIGGWYGQVCTQFPDEHMLDLLYSRAQNKYKSQPNPGMLSFTPAIVASLQVAEVVKILLKKGNLLRKKLMMIDLLDMEIEVMDILPSND